MMAENITTEYKSLRKVTSGDSGFKDLAITCVALANAQGGKIVIGIEDIEKEPPKNQIILSDIVNKTFTRLRSLSFNVGLSQGDIETHINGG